MRVSHAARTHVGLVRSRNEDALYAGSRLLAVADGMGGHIGGDRASRLVIDTIASFETCGDPKDLQAHLQEAFTAANHALRSAIRAEPELHGMGTTLTAILFDGSDLGLVHAGDSRAYVLADGRLDQLSHDDTLVQQLVEEGSLTPEQARMHPRRSVLIQALMGQDDITPQLSVRSARPGDRYLLCSDGLPEGEAIASTLKDAADPSEAVDRLVELGLQHGGRDNITCIVADIVDEP